MIKRLAYGVKKFDEAMEGGIPELFVILHVGVPGTFKTISALRWAIEGALKGENVIYVSTEQPGFDIEAQIVQMANNDERILDDLIGNFAIVSELGSCVNVNGECIDTTLRSPSLKSLQYQIENVMNVLRWHKVDRIVIDSVSTFWAQAPAKARQMSIELKKYLQSLRTTTITISQTSSLTGQSFGWAIEFIADGIIRFERKEPRLGDNEKEIEYYALIEKLRLTRHSKKWIKLEFEDFKIA